MKTRFTLLFALCIAVTANAQVAPLDIQLDHLKLHWTVTDGLVVTCDGRTFLEGQAGPVCAYPTGWTWSYTPAPAERMSAKLTTQGQRKIMTIECRDPKVHWIEIVTAGPNDRFTIAYTYTQDAWDQAINSEVNLCRPAVSWLVGATWKAMGDGGTTTGQIPLAFGGVSNPFSNAKQIEFASLFGKLTISATRPLTLYDYKDRKQFWLGRDEPFLRKVEQSWSVDLAYEPAPFTVAGVKVSDLRSPEGLGGERAEMSMGLARTVEGPTKVTARLVADLPDPAPADARDVTLAEKPSAVKLTVPLPGPGRYTVHLELIADGNPIYQSPPLSAVVPQLLSLAAARVPFMTGDKASAIVRVDPAAGDDLRVVITSGTTQLAEGPVTAGRRAILPLALASLPAGRSQLTAALLRGGERLSRAVSDVIVAGANPNAVVLDNLSHTMLVRGMPFASAVVLCCQGAPVPEIVETETPLGFNVIAPYYDNDIPQRRKMRDEIRKLLDRCAQVGMYVNLDIRQASHPPHTDDKWQWLKEEIEAFRDHPALLSYYLADEPELGWASAEDCILAYRKIKELDPWHPVTMVFCVPSAAAAYSPGMDIVMTDPYPIPGGPVTRVVDYVERIRGDTGDRLPMWIVPQAFGGGEGWAREPSRQEERVMTYLALIHGARGVQYFIRRPPVVNPTSPDLWSECRRLMLELSQLTPALCSDEDAPKVTCAQPEVHVAAFKERGAVTILAANVENRPMPLEISLDVPFDGSADVVFENRRVAVSKGKIADMIDAMSTRVYRVQIEPAPVGPAKIDPRNLTSNPSFEEAANVGTPDGAYIGYGADKAASWYVDPRTAAHGRQSLRLRAPVEGQGISVAPFPVGLTPGKRYRLSVWAKGERAKMKFRLGLDAVTDPEAVHEMTTEWS